MVNLEAYFQVWKLRLASLQTAFGKIKVLPKEAQLMQALVVRNACFEFTKELEVAFEIILADFVRRQDELFLATMDEIDLVAFRKKPWPLDSSVPAQLAEQKKEMKQRVKEWAQQAADHEKSVSFVLECYRREAYVVIGQLTLVYGVSPREGKKKR